MWSARLPLAEELGDDLQLVGGVAGAELVGGGEKLLEELAAACCLGGVGLDQKAPAV